MRLCVRWLHVCAGEEKRTLRKSAFWTGDVTEKRTLGANPHGKAHSAPGPDRKSAFCATAHMQNAPFGEAHTQNALFRESDTPRVRLYVSRRLQSGALVYAVATRFAEASTHTNPRRAENCPPIVRSCSYCWRSSVHSASCLNCCVVI